MHADICKTLTSSRRLEIIDLLRTGEKTVNELAQLAGVSQANLSQHLAVLRQRKIVTARRESQNIYYSIANPKILQAFDTMREVLLEQLTKEEKLVNELLLEG